MDFFQAVDGKDYSTAANEKDCPSGSSRGSRPSRSREGNVGLAEVRRFRIVREREARCQNGRDDHPEGDRPPREGRSVFRAQGRSKPSRKDRLWPRDRQGRRQVRPAFTEEIKASSCLERKPDRPQRNGDAILLPAMDPWPQSCATSTNGSGEGSPSSD
jgi:hypothetical protein